VGFGGSYRKGSKEELAQRGDIGTVLGGQVWMVKPDREAAAAHPCLWMQTGVVEFKNCNNYYDCHTCKYDIGMEKKASRGKVVSWQDAMRRRPALDRVCRHSLTGRIPKRACAYDYQCGTCDFDQYFEDFLTPKTAFRPDATHMVKGFDVPQDHYFHMGHTWARVESGGHIRIGLDDFALKLLGEADGYELPLMGKELDPGKAGWGIKRKDNEADVLSPIGGVITEVNGNIRENPGLTNRDPYGDGWLFLVSNPKIKKSVKDLMEGTACIDWISNEVQQLEGMIEEVAGPLAADGGYLTEDIYGKLPDLGWKNLTRTFLKNE
jgi:glycine cleavage system H lipoate-binding protein/uncharacterized CHY-type Zn-finger protein